MATIHKDAIVKFTKGKPRECMTGSLIATDDARYFVILYDPPDGLNGRDPNEVCGQDVTSSVDTVTQDLFSKYHVDGAICVEEASSGEV